MHLVNFNLIVTKVNTPHVHFNFFFLGGGGVGVGGYPRLGAY